MVKKKILVVCENDIDQIKFCLPPKNVGKYKRGRTLLIAGSENYPGASSLAIKVALASGVGYIKTLLPEKIAVSKGEGYVMSNLIKYADNCHKTLNFMTRYMLDETAQYEE